MPQGSPIQNLPSKLQFMLLQFLNICFLYHPLPQTALQFIHTLGLTLPFPSILIYQCSHHTRITKPAKTSMTQINQKGLSSQNIDTKSLKAQLTKAKLPEPQSSPVYPQSPSWCSQRWSTVLEEMPGLTLLGRHICYCPLSCCSQAPSHNLVQYLPFLSSFPTSHFPLLAQAKVYLSWGSYCCWDLHKCWHGHSLTAFAPVGLCPTKQFCRKKRKGIKSNSPPSISDAQRMFSLTTSHDTRQVIYKKMNIVSQRKSTGLSATKHSEPD